MYKYILQSIDHINWLAVGPLIIFFFFFIFVIISTLRKKGSFIEKMGKLPLEEE